MYLSLHIASSHSHSHWISWIVSSLQSWICICDCDQTDHKQGSLDESGCTIISSVKHCCVGKSSGNEDEAWGVAAAAAGLQFTGLELCEASGSNSCLGGIATTPSVMRQVCSMTTSSKYTSCGLCILNFWPVKSVQYNPLYIVQHEYASSETIQQQTNKNKLFIILIAMILCHWDDTLLDWYQSSDSNMPKTM